MITIVQSSGATLTANMSVADFQSLISAAAPSPWISFTEASQGTIYLNTESISYYYNS